MRASGETSRLCSRRQINHRPDSSRLEHEARHKADCNPTPARPTNTSHPCRDTKSAPPTSLPTYLTAPLAFSANQEASLALWSLLTDPSTWLPQDHQRPPPRLRTDQPLRITDDAPPHRTASGYPWGAKPPPRLGRLASIGRSLASSPRSQVRVVSRTTVPVSGRNHPPASLRPWQTANRFTLHGTGTPGFQMSLSRSPSPLPAGGWSSPGLDINTSGRSSPSTAFPGSNGNQVVWESARIKNMGNGGYPSFATQNQGFFTRHMRRISNSLPQFNTSTHYAEKEKLQKGKWAPAQSVPLYGRIRNLLARMGRKSKLRILLVLLLLLATFIFYQSRTSRSRPLELLHILTLHSFDIPLAQEGMARWRRKVCHHTGRQRRWWCHGMERRPRVGDRARQHAQQKEVRREVGLRAGSRRHEHQEALRPRVARELGKSGLCQECVHEISQGRVVSATSA